MSQIIYEENVMYPQPGQPGKNPTNPQQPGKPQ